MTCDRCKIPRPGALAPSAGLIALAAAMMALSAGPAVAVPVPIDVQSLYSSGVLVTPSLTGSGGRAGVNSVASHWDGNVYEFGGTAYSAGDAYYSVFGSSSAGMVTMHWPLVISTQSQAASDPLELWLDWQIDLIGSHDALGGFSSGVGKVDITLMKSAPAGACAGGASYPGAGVWCPVGTTHHWESVSPGSGGNLIDLGAFDPDEPAMVDVSFTMATVSQTSPLFGFYASGLDLGIAGFSVWADDGTAPPVIPEPPGLALTGAALLSLLALRRRPMTLPRR